MSPTSTTGEPYQPCAYRHRYRRLSPFVLHGSVRAAVDRLRDPVESSASAERSGDLSSPGRRFGKGPGGRGDRVDHAELQRGRCNSCRSAERRRMGRGSDHRNANGRGCRRCELPVDCGFSDRFRFHACVDGTFPNATAPGRACGLLPARRRLEALGAASAHLNSIRNDPIDRRRAIRQIDMGGGKELPLAGSRGRVRRSAGGCRNANHRYDRLGGLSAARFRAAHRNRIHLQAGAELPGPRWSVQWVLL